MADVSRPNRPFATASATAVEGARLAGQITDNAEWREGRPAQVEVAEADLVATVRGILDAQAAER